MRKFIFVGLLSLVFLLTGCIQQDSQVAGVQNNFVLCDYNPDYEVQSPKLVKLDQDFDLKLFQSAFIQDTYNQVQFKKHVPTCNEEEGDCYQNGTFSVTLYRKDWQALYSFGEWKENNKEFNYDPLKIIKGETKSFTYPNIESFSGIKPLKITLNSISGKCLETTANLRITEVSNN